MTRGCAQNHPDQALRQEMSKIVDQHGGIVVEFIGVLCCTADECGNVVGLVGSNRLRLYRIS